MANELNQKVTTLTVFDRQRIAVHKFGGSSLASQSRLGNVANIIAEQTNAEDFIVVSANGEITDWLLAHIAGDNEALYRVIHCYSGLVCSLIEAPAKLIEFLDESIWRIKNLDLSDEEILSYGEVWSAKLLTELLNQQGIATLYVDARDILKANTLEGEHCFNEPYFDQGIERLLYGNYGKRLVITGYIAKNNQGQTITLGRNGSDYTATQLANFSQAKSVTLWTDVKGIYSADPRLVKKAQPIKSLSYNEAKSLAAIGTNVLHSKTIFPLEKNKIPLYVRASTAPWEEGTLVQAESSDEYQIKSVALNRDLFKVTVSASDRFCQKRILHELFEKQINYFLPGEDSETNTFSLLINQYSLQSAKQILEENSLAFKIHKGERALIGLVGKNIAKDQLFIPRLRQLLDEAIVYRVLNASSNDLVTLVAKVDDSVKALNQIYQVCISDAHTASSVKNTRQNLVLQKIEEQY